MNYLSPECEVLELKVEGMLCQSPGFNGFDEDNEKHW